MNLFEIDKIKFLLLLNDSLKNNFLFIIIILFLITYTNKINNCSSL